MNETLIFLDIDGVLGHFGSDGALDPACVQRLASLVERTGACVVIASSWREMHSPSEMQEILEEHGFVGQVVGETPVLLGQPRGEEIRAYVESAGNVTAYVILDDNADLAPVTDHAVMVDDFVGLTDADVEAAARLLGG